jgi:hypothetical protein
MKRDWSLQAPRKRTITTRCCGRCCSRWLTQRRVICWPECSWSCVRAVSTFLLPKLLQVCTHSLQASRRMAMRRSNSCSASSCHCMTRLSPLSRGNWCALLCSFLTVAVCITEVWSWPCKQILDEVVVPFLQALLPRTFEAVLLSTDLWKIANVRVSYDSVWRSLMVSVGVEQPLSSDATLLDHAHKQLSAKISDASSDEHVFQWSALAHLRCVRPWVMLCVAFPVCWL